MLAKQTKKIDHWSLLAGIGIIIVGFYIFINPLASLRLLTIFIGTLVLGMGVYHLLLNHQVARDNHQNRGWLIFNAILDILIGSLLILSNGFSFYLVALLFSVWFISNTISVLKKIISVNLHSNQPFNVVLLIGALLGIGVGILFLINPLLANLAAVISIVCYCLVAGVKFIIHAFKKGL
ncbi:HdeD family acid-resistance protein [Fructilactobacillus florum]|uniref:Integral membrane protein n=1 Tax=Fructilactobacillus florum DSM 22689 = JCM 16035 TaxID=1423745 RepID=A0A0R2CIT3_9LACO|nr:DUF308 domain-containing protein [Fructilactobacillus florum]KRM91253.1 hypothetical protein FC87_GL000972 [Fructilactobacillus florum DSM 22689 = JCM 16035]